MPAIHSHSLEEKEMVHSHSNPILSFFIRSCFGHSVSTVKASRFEKKSQFLCVVCNCTSTVQNPSTVCSLSATSAELCRYALEHYELLLWNERECLWIVAHEYTCIFSEPMKRFG